MIIETGTYTDFKHAVLLTVKVWRCSNCGAGFTIPAEWTEWYDANIDETEIRWCPKCWAEYRHASRNWYQAGI